MSTWDAEPQGSRWYGEIIFGGEDWTDYACGYSVSAARPSLSSLREILPDGAKVLERKIAMTSGHPRWKLSRESDDHDPSAMPAMESPVVGHQGGGVEDQAAVPEVRHRP